MEITFEQDYLSDLYYKGKCNDKKHRYQPQIIRKYIRVIDVLRAAERVEDLFRINSLNYEVMNGDKKGRESVRVNNQYRVEFTTEKVVSKTIITVCNVLELSNHYD